MKRNETFGSPVSPEVIKVIKAREAFLSSNTKTPREHSLINSNTAWVKLRSSINEIDEDQQKEFLNDTSGKLTLTGDSTKAKQFILFNGRQSFEKGSGYSIKQGLDKDKSPAYTFDDRLGYRPMPGITNFKVASKNTYGTLLQAEVDFVVWTLEDLESAELLFFRPGYSCLLEWGHSVIVTPSSECREVSSESFSLDDDYFFNTKGASVKFIEDDIAAKRKESDFQYDALFGFITNFSWQYRSDGGYDCSLRIVSRGTVLDSIKTGNTEDNTDQLKEKIEKNNEHRKSIYHGIFGALENASTLTSVTIDGKKTASDYFESKKFVNKLKDFKAFGFQLDVVKGKYALYFNERDIDVRYIPLYTVIDIFNNYIAIKDPTTKTRFSEFVLDNPNKYLTFPQHYSLDPLVAIVPKIPKNSKTGIETSKFIISKRDLHKKMSDFAESQGGSDKIHNIMVSTEYVKTTIDNVLDAADTEEVGMLDVFQSILTGINEAFGGINELDITTTEDGSHTIVDRKNPEREEVKNMEALNLTGLNSTVVDIGLSSKISSQIAAQVSIAAQGSTGNYKDNVSTILQWNKGAIDRIIPVKRPNDDDVKEQAKKTEEAQAEFINDLIEVFEDFNEFDADYLGATWSELKPANTALIKRLLREHIADEPNPVTPGVVPVELSIKMLGITGFKVGLAFKIKEGLLPSKYDKYGYIITGLENEIGTDNRWYTTISTQFYNIF